MLRCAGQTTPHASVEVYTSLCKVCPAGYVSPGYVSSQLARHGFEMLIMDLLDSLPAAVLDEGYSSGRSEQ